MSKDKYIWKLRKRKWNIPYFDNPDELDYFNFPFCRRKSGYRRLLRIQSRLKEYFQEYKIKLYASDKLKERDPYEDRFAQAWLERKSWKRNSSRKHQWRREVELPF